MPIIGETEPDGVWKTRRSEIRAALKAAFHHIPWTMTERDDWDTTGLKLTDEMADHLEVLTAWQRLKPIDRRGWRLLFLRCHDLLNQEQTAMRIGYSRNAIQVWEAQALDEMAKQVYLK